MSRLSTRLASVKFQLDYHLSSQFAGLVVAQSQGIYAKRGLNVDLLAPPIPGAEPALVTSMQEAALDEHLVLGCVEQNTLIAAQLYGRHPIRAVSAMLHSTPLAVATAPGRGINSLKDLAGKSIAAADDTEEIVRSALADVDPALPSDVTIVPMPRENKLTSFMSGEVDCMQVYTTTEALQLQEEFNEPPVLMPFGEKHGFAQVCMPETCILLFNSYLPTMIHIP